MIFKIQAVAMVLMLAIPSVAMSEDFPSEQFEPTTLADAAHELESEVTNNATGNGQAINHKAGDILVIGPFWRRRVQVIYTGRHRDMDSAAIAFYRGYEKAHAVENSLVDHYRDVYLFQENGVDYWLPVQDQVAAYFPRELKPGDSIQLYLIVTGGYLRTDGWAWIFPVEEFSATQ